MKKTAKTLVGTFAIFALFFAGCGELEQAHTDSHEGHGAKEERDQGDHEVESESAHDEENEIELSAEAMKMAEITLAKAGRGTISISLELSGEVGFNEDRLVHITPRFPGIVKEARFRLGEFVRAGEVVAVIESNESMTPYSLKAPIAGRIIEKHIAVGEHASEEESIYLLADLSNVWVNLAVYPKDAAKIKIGQKAKISAIGSVAAAEGTIQYVTPVMDAQTRRITARVVLPNADDTWRPGTFANAHIEVGEGEPGLVVERNAVQVLENRSVVFVQHEPGRFEPVEVSTGESDNRWIRILSGLEPGTEYINKGAFELKAKIVTSSLGGHAGHGH